MNNKVSFTRYFIDKYAPNAVFIVVFWFFTYFRSPRTTNLYWLVVIVVLTGLILGLIAKTREEYEDIHSGRDELHDRAAKES